MAINVGSSTKHGIAMRTTQDEIKQSLLFISSYYFHNVIPVML